MKLTNNEDSRLKFIGLAMLVKIGSGKSKINWDIAFRSWLKSRVKIQQTN